VSDDLEQSLLKMANDPDTPAHLRLGALKQSALFRRAEMPAANRNGRPMMADRDDGRPPDPLLERFPELLRDEDGRPQPADPMADLDFDGWVGRMPHPLYARVLYAVPWHPTDGAGRARKDVHKGEEARILLDAEARFLRECRNRGLDVPDPDDEVDMQRWLRQLKRRKRT
jgi:hypothetical protein